MQLITVDTCLNACAVVGRLIQKTTNSVQRLSRVERERVRERVGFNYSKPKE